MGVQPFAADNLPPLRRGLVFVEVSRFNPLPEQARIDVEHASDFRHGPNLAGTGTQLDFNLQPSSGYLLRGGGLLQ